MALKPHHMLQGKIRITKEVKGIHNMRSIIERHYMDEHGDTAIVMMTDLKDTKTDL